MEVEDAGVAPVQDAQAVEAGLDVEERPHLPVDQHRVAEVLADPGHTGDVAHRIVEGAVVIELAVLDHERDLVRPAWEAVCIVGPTGVELVAQEVSGGEAGKDIQACGAHRMVVEPEECRRLLVGIVDGLRLARPESVRSDCRTAVTRCRDEAAMQMRHHTHLMSERYQPRVDWDPGGIGGGEIVSEPHGHRGVLLCHERHPERARLAFEPAAVVVGPEASFGKLRVQAS
jgi:hypothetical protein